MSYYGGGGGGYNDGVRPPKPIPEEPPFTAFIGNLPDGIVQGDIDYMFQNQKVRTFILLSPYLAHN